MSIANTTSYCYEHKVENSQIQGVTKFLPELGTYDTMAKFHLRGLTVFLFHEAQHLLLHIINY
jgi:hypothetical protein